jgi:hypothetical protein
MKGSSVGHRFLKGDFIGQNKFSGRIFVVVEIDNYEKPETFGRLREKGKRSRIVGHHFSFEKLIAFLKQMMTNYVDSNGNLFKDIKMF